MLSPKSQSYVNDDVNQASHIKPPSERPFLICITRWKALCRPPASEVAPLLGSQALQSIHTEALDSHPHRSTERASGHLSAWHPTRGVARAQVQPAMSTRSQWAFNCMLLHVACQTSSQREKKLCSLKDAFMCGSAFADPMPGELCWYDFTIF